VPRTLTTIAATIAAVLAAAGSASAATMQPDPLFGSEPVELGAGSVTSLFGYADAGGDDLRVAIHAGNTACAATAAADPGPLRVDQRVADDYSVDVPVSEQLGPQTLCAWIERGGAPAAPPVSVAFQVVAPRADLALGPPVVAHRGLPFTLAIQAGSEGNDRRVFGTLVAGTTCPATPTGAPAGIAALPPAGWPLSSPKDLVTAPLKPAPGTYRLCAWVQPSATAVPEASASLAVTIPARRTRTKVETSNWINKHGTSAHGAVYVAGAVRGTVVLEAATDVVGSPWHPVKRLSIAGWRHTTTCHAVCEVSTSARHLRIRVPVGFNVRARFLGTPDAAPSRSQFISVMPW
jgi:hypothetical protein